MANSALRRGSRLGITLTIVTGLLFIAAPVQASERPIDITGYKVSNITVSSSSCRNITVTATTAIKSDFLDSYGSVDITRQGGLVDNLSIDGRKITNRAFICPSLSGLGTYKVGPAAQQDLLHPRQHQEHADGQALGIPGHIDGQGPVLRA